MKPALLTALELAREGFAVYPLVERSKSPLAGSHGRGDAATDADRIRAWFGGRERLNLAVATGGGLLVVDLDRHGQEDGVRAFRQWADERGELPRTAVCRTGSGGAHLWFTSPTDIRIRTRAGFPVAGVDIRADGGSAIVPPSVHPNGRRYVWTRGLHALATAPDWLIEELRERPRPAPPAVSIDDARHRAYGCRVLREEADRAKLAQNGTRNDTLHRASFRVGRCIPAGLVDPAGAESVLVHAGIYAGLPEAEARRVVVRGLADGARIAPREVRR